MHGCMGVRVVDEGAVETARARVAMLERLIVHLHRGDPLTDDEGRALEQVLVDHQDEPVLRLGEVVVGQLYWAECGSHIGGTRRGSRKRHPAPFGPEGSFLVTVTRILNRHMVEALTPLGMTELSTPRS